MNLTTCNYVYLNIDLPNPNPNLGGGGNNIFSKSWPPPEAVGKAKGGLWWLDI